MSAPVASIIEGYYEAVRAIGIAVTMVGDTKATAYGILLDGAGNQTTVVEKFEITSDEADLATRTYDLAESVRSRVDAFAPDCVGVRRADFPPQGSRKEAPKLRLLAEGAIVSAARSRCTDTYLGTGKDIGTWCGVKKEDVETQAAQLLKDSGIAQKFSLAAAAALGALSHP
jgi:hypothetical protein